jgi:hypothetical protein
MALYGRDLLLPLYGHLDGTSGRRWSKSGPLHGQAQSGALPDIRRPRKLDQQAQGGSVHDGFVPTFVETSDRGTNIDEVAWGEAGVGLAGICVGISIARCG